MIQETIKFRGLIVSIDKKDKYSLFLSIPAVGTKFTWRNTDGRNQVVQSMITKRCDVDR